MNGEANKALLLHWLLLSENCEVSLPAIWRMSLVAGAPQ
jgi:hypothetical protein